MWRERTQNMSCLMSTEQTIPGVVLLKYRFTATSDFHTPSPQASERGNEVFNLFATDRAARIRRQTTKPVGCHVSCYLPRWDKKKKGRALMFVFGELEIQEELWVQGWRWRVTIEMLLDEVGYRYMSVGWGLTREVRPSRRGKQSVEYELCAEREHRLEVCGSVLAPGFTIHYEQPQAVSMKQRTDTDNTTTSNVCFDSQRWKVLFQFEPSYIHETQHKSLGWNLQSHYQYQATVRIHTLVTVGLFKLILTWNVTYINSDLLLLIISR